MMWIETHSGITGQWRAMQSPVSSATVAYEKPLERGWANQRNVSTQDSASQLLERLIRYFAAGVPRVGDRSLQEIAWCFRSRWIRVKDGRSLVSATLVTKKTA